MSENSASKKIKDLGDSIKNNKSVQSIKNSLKSGKIDINQLKNFAQSDDIKSLKNSAMNTLLDVGQSYLNKAKTKMNPPVKKESYYSWRDDFNPIEIESYDVIKAKPLGEGNRIRYRGYGLSGSGNKKDMSKGPNEPAPVDYRLIQAKDSKNKRVISASYQLGEGKKKLNPNAIFPKIANVKIKNEIISDTGISNKNPVKKKFTEQSCGKGEYYCNTDKKCKPIPEGYKVRENGFLVKEGVASAVLKVPAVKKTISKVGGAVLAAKGGEKILKDLLGTPGKPKATDWDKNPKDKIDQELNVRQNKAKDKAKYKEFDKDMKSFRKGKKNLDNQDKVQRLKDAAKKYQKIKNSKDNK